SVSARLEFPKTFSVVVEYLSAVAGDAVDFLSWFLNALHMALGGNKKKKTIINSVFQGSMRIFTKKLPPPDLVSSLFLPLLLLF
ncbi:hypothetical protein chiPu_0026284, partial [Chiloscyllium punctatum]|nr:hypothetical protein [Chiloscyllium punctatum]